jgi:cytochrome P450
MLELFDQQTLSIVASLISLCLGTTILWIHRHRSAALASTTTTITTTTTTTITTAKKQPQDDESTATTTTTTPDWPPSPKEKHWLWKHGVALRGDGVSSHDITFLRWMQTLESKVVLFDVPVLGKLIVVGDASLAKHVLQSKVRDTVHGGTKSAFPKSPTYSNVRSLIGRKSIVTMEGSEWSHQRKVFNPGFSPEYLRGIVATIAKKCDRFLESCDNQDIAHHQPTNLLTRSIDYTSDVIAQVAFGEDWGYNSKEDNGGMKTLLAFRELINLIAEMKNPIEKLKPWNHWKMQQLSASLDEDMKRLVQRRLATIRQQSQEQHNNNKEEEEENQKAQKDILSLTLSGVLKENNPNKTASSSSSEIVFGDDDMECMTSQLKTFYFAGHDTTAITIAWAFWSLLQNPGALQRARDEVREHLGQDWTAAVETSEDPRPNNNIIPEESTTYENLQKCQYLDAIARETLRLYPPAASVRHQPDPNATFENYKIGGSILILNAYAIQRDPDIWGPDADDFRPERFLGEEGRTKINSFGFLPFSKGSRDCIGKYFAMLETKIALAALVTRYDGTAVDASQEVYTARLTSAPKNGCLVKLVRRSKA